ncbi:MOSC domain-containing protein [Peziza echinospora]|nr:MOSC domain-containing protein [Peziza echinospora]
MNTNTTDPIPADAEAEIHNIFGPLIVSAAATVPLGYRRGPSQRARAAQQLPPPSEISMEMEGSNLADEFGGSGSGKKPQEQAQWRVKSLWIYPVKSCRGVEVGEGRVVETGLQYDRQFTFAEWKLDPKTGVERWVFITQRQYPLMARINQIEIQGRSDEYYQSKFPMEEVKIWREVVPAYNLSTLLPSTRSLPAFLGLKPGAALALLRIPPSRPRMVYKCAPKPEEIGYQPQTGFADSYPLHIINLASVRDLNSRLDQGPGGKPIPELSVRRFRANIIVEGPPAYAEDDWKVIKVGGNTIHTSCRTTRCNLPNTNPDTGEKHPTEPAKTLKSYRCIDAGASLSACMGMQAVPVNLGGTIKVGDKVEVVARCYRVNIDI